MNAIAPHSLLIFRTLVRQNSILLLGWVCCAVWSCSKPIPQQAKLSIEENVEVGRDINGYLSQYGRTKAKLNSPLMVRTMNDSMKTEFPNRLTVLVYNDSMQWSNTVNALYGAYFQTVGLVYLRDSVVLLTSQGDTLKSAEMYWNQYNHTFYSTKHVIILRPNGKTYGTAFTSDEKLQNITIQNPTGTMAIGDSAFLQ